MLPLESQIRLGSTGPEDDQKGIQEASPLTRMNSPGQGWDKSGFYWSWKRTNGERCAVRGEVPNFLVKFDHTFLSVFCQRSHDAGPGQRPLTTFVEAADLWSRLRLRASSIREARRSR